MRPEQYTILIVDDNITNLDVIANYLEEAGHFKILVALSGERCLEIAQRGQPDLILLDGIMPDMDGFETCRYLKANPETKDIPVIFMTALADKANKIKGFEAGAVDYVTKPIQFEEILRRIDTHLRLRQQARWLEAQNVRLEISQQVAQRISSILHLDKLLLEVVQLLQQQFHYYYVAIWLVEKGQLSLKAEAAQPGAPLLGRKMGLSLDAPQSIMVHVYRTGQFYLVNEVATDPHYLPLAELTETKSELALPLSIPEQVIGVLDIQSNQPDAFIPDDMTLLQTIASQISMAVTNAALFEAAKEANELLEQRVQQRTNLLEQQAVELREARMKAEAANKAKSAFLATMSHELRTPLNAVLGFSQLMRRDPQLTASQVEYLQTINRSGEHLLGLINDILDMSKIEAGQMVLHEHDFDLYQLLDELQQLFELRVRDKEVQLIFERAAEVPRYIQADEDKLRQVLLNLLSNAVKFTAQGRVTVRLYQKAKLVEPTQVQLHFEVQDSGYGIGVTELATLFDPFVQTESGRRSHQGTGLGLPISRHFVQMLGGNLGVDSQLGHGSTFRFDIRARVVEGQAVLPTVEAMKPVLRLADGQPRYRVLVVEDKLENRQLLVGLLESVGFEVAEAVNGLEGVEKWEAWQPHLIFMDMRMPVMDGYEATRQIRARTPDSGGGCVIMAITASAFEDDVTQILGAGCDDVILKPFREAEIWQKLARHLGVTYLYAEEIAPTVASEAVTSVTLAQLPVEWVGRLEQATIAGNYGELLALVEEMRTLDAVLADRLADWVDNFEYDKILAWLAK